MEKQLSHMSLGKIYRQFSRQKYNKYRHQFPYMRESQLVVKIIRQWERMDMKEKIRLNQRFVLKNYYLLYEQHQKELLSTNKKSDCSPQKQNEPEVIIRTYPSYKNQFRVVDEESNFNRESMRIESNKQEKQSSSYLVARVIQQEEKTKAFKALKRQRYIRFFKTQYDRQVKLHPNWDSRQVSHIIKLLWASKMKDEKISKRLTKKKLILKKRVMKNLSGRQFFNKMKKKKGLSIKEINNKWKRLTFEGKEMFNLKGTGKGDYGMHKNYTKDTLRIRAVQQNTIELSSFMFKRS